MVNKCSKWISACLVIILATCIPCYGQNDWNCAKPCKCKWASGKKTADCMRQEFSEVPNNLSSEIQNLDLTGNYISRLGNNAFGRVQLVNLHKLVLRENEIETIHPNAFDKLQIVIEIDLSYNRIQSLHPDTFSQTQRLRVLTLNDNNLEVLQSGLFYNLTYLQKIILSDNQLKQIEEKTFALLPGLQVLLLDSNNLSTLKYTIFEDLHKLGSLNLQNNPWNCNCLLKKFRDWTVEKKLYTKPTTCTLPVSLAGKMWDEINSEEFACLPNITHLQPDNLRIARGDDANFYCRAVGTPKPTVFWVHHSEVLTSNTNRKRIDVDRIVTSGYVVRHGSGWANLTVPQIASSDKGDYICVAKNYGGSVERNVTLEVLGELSTQSGTSLGLPLAIALGVIIFVLIILTLALYLYYCKKKKTTLNKKGSETIVPLDHHSLNEQEKSLINVNPVLKPTNRRYDNQSPANFRGDITELNRTLLDSDSIYADGVSTGGGSAGALINNGVHCNGSIVNGTSLGGSVDQVNDDHGHSIRRTPDLDIGESNLPSESMSYRQYPPDLLAFSGRGVSPTSQASTAPDNSRLPAQFGISPNPSYTKTLPHNRSGASYISSVISPALVLPRYGYVTIPRRPRAPSWGTSSPLMAAQSMSASTDLVEPVYDNLGRRTTADGSIKKPLAAEFNLATRPLPATPTIRDIVAPRFHNSSAAERTAPEGAAEWPNDFSDEQCIPEINSTSSPNPVTIRKIPPRPPPKPKKKTANGPLYEDEDEDGTEV